MLLALAIAPGLAIILFIIYRDRFEREPRWTLLMSFILGVLSTIPTLFIELSLDRFRVPTITGTIFSTFFFVALVEEVCKFIPLRYYAFTRKSFNEPLDGIVHGVMISMGFATLENIGYAYQYGLETALIRMVSAVPGHASWGVMLGYFAGKARFDYARRKVLLFTGLVLAVFFHGAYDTCLFLTQHVPEKSAVFLVLGALTSHVLALVFAARMIKLHRRTSMNLYKHAPVLTIRNASVRDVPLIRNLALHIWPDTYRSILKPKQIGYMMQLIYSEASLRKQMEERHQFIIIYNAGVPVGFASFSEVEPTIFKLHKVYILASQQGRGTGKFVIQQVINDITPKGATVLRLNVNRHNRAKGFYEKLGFTVVSEEDIDIGQGYFMNDYVMEKRLDVTELMEEGKFNPDSYRD